MNTKKEPLGFHFLVNGEAKPYRLNVADEDGRFNIKTWHYFEIDVYGVLSLINIREGVDEQKIIYTISEKRRVSKPSRRSSGS